MSLRKACALFGVSSSVYYHRSEADPIDEQVRLAIEQVLVKGATWGFWKIFHRLRAKGHRWNHKRVYRIYKAMRLNLRRSYRRRLPARIKQPLLQPLHPNMTWSMDFMSDSLSNGRTFRTFNLVDDYNREALNVTIDTSITSKRVVRELEKVVGWRGLPERLRVDNGPEFIAQALETWCEDNSVELQFIARGKPSQNAYVERFNRTYRQEVLDHHAFDSLYQVRQITVDWIQVYNHERPHEGIGNDTPYGFLCKRIGHNHFPTLGIDRHQSLLYTFNRVAV